MAQRARRIKPGKQVKADLSSLSLMREVEDLSGELSSKLDPKGVMNAIARRLVERCGVKSTAIWSLDESGKILGLDAIEGQPTLPAKLAQISPAETLLGDAIREQLPRLITPEDGARDPLVEWADQHGLKFLAAYPLMFDAKVRGILLLGCSQPPSKSMLALFRLHAKLAAVALRDAELVSASQRTLNKLGLLSDATKALSSTLDLSELLGRILDVAKSQVEAERGTLYLVDEKTDEIWSLIAHGLEKQEIRLPLGKGISGHVAKTGEIVNIPDAYADPRFNPEVDKRTGWHTRNILCLPIRNKAGKIISVLQLMNKINGVFTKDDSDFLLTLSGHMALALENAQLHQQLLDKERMEKELALARGIQRSLLPETTPLVEGFDIALLNEPCYAVGGDYYDFLNLGPRALLTVIADVEGKGVASALVMSNLQATLRALVLHVHSLNEIAEGLNRMILTDTRSQKYLSLFMGLFDVRRKTIHYINCGHVPPVIVRKNQEATMLTEGGMVIGMFENAQYERGQTKLLPGDIFFMCTDGITESMDAQHNEYGVERLIEQVRTTSDKPAAEIVSSVGADVARFSRTGTHIDDKVMIVIKVK